MQFIAEFSALGVRTQTLQVGVHGHVARMLKSWPAALVLVAALGCGEESLREKELEVELAKAKAAEAQAQAEKAKADAEQMRDQLQAVQTVERMTGGESGIAQQIKDLRAEKADRAALQADSEVRDLDRQIEELRSKLDELWQPLRNAKLEAEFAARAGDREDEERQRAARRRADELDAQHAELMRRLKGLHDAREQAARRVRGCAKNPKAWGCE